MASDEELMADIDRILKSIPNPVDEKGVLKAAKFNVRCQRDCGAAIAVGAGTVAISLLIGGGNVAIDAFYVLFAVQSLLIYAAQFFTGRAEEFVPAMSGKARYALSGVPVVILAGGSYLTSQLKQHESNIGSSSWWVLLGLAGATGLLGLIIRRAAESGLDQLDDESWKQRVAPLVDEQKRAIEETWRMRLLLQDSLKSTPPVPTQEATSASSLTPPGQEDLANPPAGPLPSAPKTSSGRTPTLMISAEPTEVRPVGLERVRRVRLGGMPRHRPSTEAEQIYQADVSLAGSRAELLDAARAAESQLRQAQARRALEGEIRRLAEELDVALTAAMRAAYAAQRAEIGPRGYDDRIYRRKAKATPRVHALTAQAERLLTLRETHRLNGIPAITFEPSPPPSAISEA